MKPDFTIYMKIVKTGTVVALFLCVFSCSLGTYDIAEAEGVERGTKIIIHLKGDAYDFAKEDKISGIVFYFLSISDTSYMIYVIVRQKIWASVD